ncbi:hypothetical protein B723_27170 [Pseudomonas fluorescens NCIMB 11764]|uniref:Uncharacterized protein n=1 Tax=Pseudomonas fluorescens NCIMB 11764 TaxID=1221522 RepID=A0A0K1QVU4_PSEFL|nr:hypothetical protein B723_27170 [Pseudomonas fluorescens NCIMB 11764]
MLVMEDYLWKSAFNYARNMTYVIFRGNLFLIPTVRYLFTRKGAGMSVKKAMNNSALFSDQNLGPFVFQRLGLSAQWFGYSH